MDEATSALDSDTEYIIKENIESLKGAYTMIVVAHRLSTIKTADRIVMLKDGCIAFIGDFETLKKNVPDFTRMVELQEL
jgi:subfamily B ATP-binding cassette protein MsbA